jgi:hypothetical protein
MDVEEVEKSTIVHGKRALTHLRLMNFGLATFKAARQPP